jgi:hypothetical protein
MFKVAARLGLPVVIVLALVACSGSDRGEPVDVAGTAAEAPPSTKSTTSVEQPRAPREDNPGISVASLPIGAPDGFSLKSDGAQCVHVDWALSDTIPTGLGVLVTGATFVPKVYRLARVSCERPTCVGHLFHGTDLTCDLAIRPARADERSLLNDPKVTTSLKGQVVCADFASAACRTFTAEVRTRAQNLLLKLPAAPVGTPGNPTGTDTGSDTPPNRPVLSSTPNPSSQASPGSNPGG